MYPTRVCVKQLTLDVLGEVGVRGSSYNDDIVLLVWLGNTDGLGRCLSRWRCLLWSSLGRLRGRWLLGGRWGWGRRRDDQKSLRCGLTSSQVKITHVSFLHFSVPSFKTCRQMVKYPDQACSFMEYSHVAARERTTTSYMYCTAGTITLQWLLIV